MGKMVKFKSNGATCDGYYAMPAGGKGPGVIVLQEWWGLVDHIKDVCDRFAKEGFCALAPDLYHGDMTKSPDQAGKLMMALNIAQTEKDLRGAVDFVLAQKECGSKKVGTVGFCMGGQLSLYAACASPEKVGACVIYYGVHPNVKPDLKALKAPVLGFFAEKDAFVTPAVVHDLEKKIKDAGKKVEFHIYPGADHAFFNDTRKEAYNAKAAGDTWTRMLAFYKANVK
jgi:carboxymethylenebutenolidase